MPFSSKASSKNPCYRKQSLKNGGTLPFTVSRRFFAACNLFQCLPV
ncbi:hypothetical protein B4099_3615 [Heyndrickxia coagulans]|uniref:Uncharacterized protein n=1 Tax=Heyndrickxia coagulans TaxID=1398 RepID=A0A150JVK9_HEYCO|nr:hypothetical protein B4099_3615 [Heyndrickxia coagulans]